MITRRSKQTHYLRIATVSASGELAQGQMTSGLSPLDWKTLRNASQEDMDPARDRGRQGEGWAVSMKNTVHFEIPAEKS